LGTRPRGLQQLVVMPGLVPGKPGHDEKRSPKQKWRRCGAILLHSNL
jgi:hypothetical protein